MASKNTIFVEYADQVFSRYKKTTVGAVCGKRLSPFDNSRIDFVLMSNWGKFNPENNRLKFNYETDVIEIYSEQEDKVFRALNAYLFHNGLIAPFDGTRDAVDTSNALGDVEITDLAATKNLLSFKKKISTLNEHNLNRLLEMVKRADRPYSFIRAIQERLEELSKN